MQNSILSGVLSSCLVTGIFFGCSDDGGSSADSNGGAGAGTTTSGSGGTSQAGGSSGTGTTGGVGTGGATIVTTFDSSATEGCSAWPVSKLFPATGPFFYGTDPKPCSETFTASGWTRSTTYGYDTSGRLVSGTAVNTDGTTSAITYEYAGDNIVAVDSSNANLVLTYSYTSSVVTVTLPSGTAAYLLDSLGYPRLLTISYAAGSQSYLYEYENCRIVRRTAQSSDASEDMTGWVYSYDDQGRLTLITATNGFAAAYDYSCWD